MMRREGATKDIIASERLKQHLVRAVDCLLEQPQRMSSRLSVYCSFIDMEQVPKLQEISLRLSIFLML